MSIKNGTTLTPEALSYLVGLIRDISGLDTKLIDDLNIKSNGSYSSLKISQLVDQALKDSKEYSDLLCSSLIKLTCEKTTTQPTLSNSEKNVIYLYSSDGNAPFQQYLKISDTELIDMGSTSISLNDYLTITDAVATYCKKTDFDTLKTEVDKVKNNKVDKTSILSTISSNPSDDKLLSEKAIKTELDNLKTNFQDGVNTIYDSVVARGVTPTDKSPSSIVEALDKTFNNSILIKEYSSDGLKIYNNRGIIEEGGYYKDEKYKICYVNVIYHPKVDLYSDGDGCLLAISGLPMPLIRNNWSNPTFLSIENIDNPNRQCKAGYGIDKDGINGCIFMKPFNNNERVRIYGAYQYSES